MTDQVRKPEGLVEIAFGQDPGESGTYRRQQATLVDDDERLSLEVASSFEKNRAVLTVLSGPAKGAVFRLNKEIVTLGRSEEADIPLPDPNLSRIHARFLRSGSGRDVRYALEDLGSTNGTFVGGKRICEPTALIDGVRLGFGRRSLMRFSVQDALEEHATIHVHDSALRDGLTRAYNRRVFDDRLRSEFAYSARHNRPLSLMLLDLDHFKRVNDTHGHPAGDTVLQVVAKQIESALRTEDVFARYGGEEFAILARDTTLSDALVVAERIRTLVAGTPVPWCGGCLGVTLSIGVTCNVPVVADAEQLIRKADSALYEAKSSGRNRVCVTGLRR